MKKTRLKDIILNDSNMIIFDNRLLMGIVLLGSFGTAPLILVFILMFEPIFGNSLYLVLISLVGPIIFLTFIGGVLYNISMLPYRIMNKLWETGLKLDGLKIYEESVVSNFEEVCNHAKKLYAINKKLNLYKRVFGFMLTTSTLRALNKFFIESNSKSISLLSNLRSDLSIRLAEQKNLLESTKSEVEMHIQGTTELGQVSEFQKARLDRQIEQFEELQKVIVKI